MTDRTAAGPPEPADSPTHRRARACLIVAGALAVFVAVMPYTQYAEGTTPAGAADPSAQGTWSRTDATFGWRSSPLLSYWDESGRVPQADGGLTGRRTSGLTVGWVSWSSLCLAVGVGLFLAARRLRIRPNPEPSKAADPDPPARPMGKRK